MEKAGNEATQFVLNKWHLKTDIYNLANTSLTYQMSTSIPPL